jgi:hypothetical protein
VLNKSSRESPGWYAGVKIEKLAPVQLEILQ